MWVSRAGASSVSALLEEQPEGVQRRVEERLAARTALEVFCVPGTWACQDLYSSTLPGSQLLCEATSSPGGLCFAAQPYPATPPPYLLKEF